MTSKDKRPPDWMERIYTQVEVTEMLWPFRYMVTLNRGMLEYRSGFAVSRKSAHRKARRWLARAQKQEARKTYLKARLEDAA